MITTLVQFSLSAPISLAEATTPVIVDNQNGTISKAAR
jgi:hypothetical protein